MRVPRKAAPSSTSYAKEEHSGNAGHAEVGITNATTSGQLEEWLGDLLAEEHEQVDECATENEDENGNGSAADELKRERDIDGKQDKMACIEHCFHVPTHFSLASAFVRVWSEQDRSRCRRASIIALFAVGFIQSTS